MKSLVPVVLILVWMIVGCGGGANFVGAYSTDIDQAKIPSGASGDMALMRKLFSAFTLNIKSDHTFEFNAGPDKESGTWDASGNKLTMKFNSNMKQAWTLTVEDGGKTLRQTGHTGEGSDYFVFTRK